jgi:hypothetical protein
LEHLNQVLVHMLRTSKLDMTKTINPDDVDVFLDNAGLAICSTCHTVLKASPGVAIFGCNMLFNIPLIVDWKKLEITGNAKLILTQYAKTACKSIMITKLAIRFC